MPDPVAPAGEDPELRALVEQALQATYELGAEIGRGGMGIVYRARDRRLKRQVAIKLLPPELAFRRDVRTRFLREAETAAQLSHPNIVPIYSVDEIGNLVFFVMACVDGDNLARQLQQRGTLPVEQVRRWTREVSEALAFAHARGVIHRDIKPDNILVDAIDGRAVVTDFGIARAASESGDASRLTATGAAIGTPAYMSPEQASGDRDVDARSDLYSLGVVAYQMLCGSPPFTANTMPAMLVKHLAEAPVPVGERRPDVPADLAELVMRLLEKNPDHRVQTATEVAQAASTGVLPLAPARLRSGRGGASPIPLDGSPIGGMPKPGAPAPAPAYQAPAYTSRTGVIPLPGAVAPAPPSRTPPAATADTARWYAPAVERFRKKLGPYLIVNSVILVLAIVSPVDLLSVSAFWTIYLAFQYSRLWTDGYDWRDVLRQPRDRELGDVISDFGEEVEATFSHEKRERLRAQGHYKSGQPRTRDGLPAGAPAARLPAAATDGGASSLSPAAREAVGRVRELLGEVARLYAALPARSRQGAPDPRDLTPAVQAGVGTVVRELAAAPSHGGPDALAAIEREIAALEAEANPLDAAGSEARVRRLAQLRRDRRGVRDGQAREGQRLAQLQGCAAQLEAMRRELQEWQAAGGAGGDAHVMALGSLMADLGASAQALARPVSAAAPPA